MARHVVLGHVVAVAAGCLGEFVVECVGGRLLLLRSWLMALKTAVSIPASLASNGGSGKQPLLVGVHRRCWLNVENHRQKFASVNVGVAEGVVVVSGMAMDNGWECAIGDLPVAMVG